MISKYCHTLIHLKPIQIHYQLWYRIRRSWRRLTRFQYPLQIEKNGYPVVLKPSIIKSCSLDNYKFTFLHQSRKFNNNVVDWDFINFGKLWTYNLNYFDYLLQPGLKQEEGWRLINDYISKLDTNSIGLEAYPISLRSINWIKFISQGSSPNSELLTLNPQISNSLYAQYLILLDNLEYHLLGNHLLENGFSLLFGAFFFNDYHLYTKAEEIITKQLKEQILDDGGHFELSPMYHQIILDRLLDCINLLSNNEQFEKQEKLLAFMQDKSIEMLKWINCMTFSNGLIPLLNDSTPGIAPNTEELNNYALRLEILSQSTFREIRQNSCNSYLKGSGYRRFDGANYECILDVGHIGSEYQPGHAHADTFNFVLNIKNFCC